VKHVLKNSLDLLRYDYYTVGTYDRKAEQYVPFDPAGDEHRLRYDYGNFYASKTFYDPAKRRRILWGWANESDTAADDVAKGWAGIQVCYVHKLQQLRTADERSCGMHSHASYPSTMHARCRSS
jgi:hypothetical protein